ncbi:MAG TPA: DUF3048 domain-containing protein [Candidatus Acidoferrum sp.]|nr:DUF3048 domain-containing protein [Candidatus Acidoferrum sp.]
MRRSLPKAAALAMGLALTAFFTGCTPKAQPAGPAPEGTKSEVPVFMTAALLEGRAPAGLALTRPKPEKPQEPPPEELPYVNPVTGLGMATPPGRPVAVVINNLKKATPQVGVSHYELMFEYPAEGEITRLVDVMYDYAGFEELGSVRSMRDYFMVGALPLDPIFIHYGHSPAAIHYIMDNGITSLNGINADVERVLYWRDKARISSMGYEHSVLTSSKKISAAIAAFGVRDTTEKTAPFFDFSGWQAGDLPGESVKVQFVNNMTGVFTFDGERYLRSQFGKEQIDGTTGEQLTCDTVIVLKTYCQNIPGDESLRRRCDLVGSGSGYAFSGGSGRKIKWSKASDGEFFVLTNPDGSTLTLSPGKIWICVMDTSRSVVNE